ncbi:N-acetylmuramoyl-L-alanine amidase CwlD [Effusibacillus lacus]|uniref:N-acetylmuramoyl-L-alanine amidase CwlD n=1 Tax=Effusibacillus lacus TaxID=1348429 RepID=A0A292YHP2_9BACL|nr:N-acetylmuramoyl-L-alanine amidase CwlD [Effusibacillus lacus]TCS69207.1 N-acetylmuramoyl-L-alanine amidase [Effusibacillus lacus]GAX89288.1 N-acetylmuramoyl-L-alanine amidase CwlD [Effusibacillus lacus]
MILKNEWRTISIVAGTLAIIMFIVNVVTADIPITKLWPWSAPLSGYTIVIDPGHGGPDGGAVAADGTIEKTITLTVSQYLRDYLQQAGAYVIMTRDDDRDLASPETKGYSKRKWEDLKERLSIIRENNASMFCSIHLNSNPGGGKGAQVFYDTELEASKLLAQAIQSQFQKQLNSKRAIEPQEDLYLLRNSHVPAVLAEVGFLSNTAELALLKQKSYQKKIAYSMYQGILEYVTSSQTGK